MFLFIKIKKSDRRHQNRRFFNSFAMCHKSDYYLYCRLKRISTKTLILDKLVNLHSLLLIILMLILSFNIAFSNEIVRSRRTTCSRPVGLTHALRIEPDNCKAQTLLKRRKKGRQIETHSSSAKFIILIRF